MAERILILTLGLTVLAACTVENDRADQDSASFADSARIKDQVLDIVCNYETRNVQRELVQVVNYARQRDGRSDRVWEVADNADCRELERGFTQTG